jgi:F-type H+-transporting ATPase subunit b
MFIHAVLVSVTALDPSGAHSKPDIMTADGVMAILTWVTFLGLLFILQKFAWGPILTTLQTRERTIRDSLEKAQQVENELNELQQYRSKIISDARGEASVILEDSRKKAVENARLIELQAKAHAKEILEAAQETIEGEKERVRTSLRKESASVAVNLASLLIKENLDGAKSNRLIEQYIKEL